MGAKGSCVTHAGYVDLPDGRTVKMALRQGMVWGRTADGDIFEVTNWKQLRSRQGEGGDVEVLVTLPRRDPPSHGTFDEIAVAMSGDALRGSRGRRRIAAAKTATSVFGTLPVDATEDSGFHRNNVPAGSPALYDIEDGDPSREREAYADARAVVNEVLRTRTVARVGPAKNQRRGTTDGTHVMFKMKLQPNLDAGEFDYASAGELVELLMGRGGARYARAVTRRSVFAGTKIIVQAWYDEDYDDWCRLFNERVSTVYYIGDDGYVRRAEVVKGAGSRPLRRQRLRPGDHDVAMPQARRSVIRALLDAPQAQPNFSRLLDDLGGRYASEQSVRQELRFRAASLAAARHPSFVPAALSAFQHTDVADATALVDELRRRPLESVHVAGEEVPVRWITDPQALADRLLAGDGTTIEERGVAADDVGALVEVPDGSVAEQRAFVDELPTDVNGWPLIVSYRLPYGETGGKEKPDLKFGGKSAAEVAADSRSSFEVHCAEIERWTEKREAQERAEQRLRDERERGIAYASLPWPSDRPRGTRWKVIAPDGSRTDLERDVPEGYVIIYKGNHGRSVGVEADDRGQVPALSAPQAAALLAEHRTSTPFSEDESDRLSAHPEVIAAAERPGRVVTAAQRREIAETAKRVFGVDDEQVEGFWTGASSYIEPPKKATPLGTIYYDRRDADLLAALPAGNGSLAVLRYEKYGGTNHCLAYLPDPPDRLHGE